MNENASEQWREHAAAAAPADARTAAEDLMTTATFSNEVNYFRYV